MVNSCFYVYLQKGQDVSEKRDSDRLLINRGNTKVIETRCNFKKELIGQMLNVGRQTFVQTLKNRDDMSRSDIVKDNVVESLSHFSHHAVDKFIDLRSNVFILTENAVHLQLLKLQLNKLGVLFLGHSKGSESNLCVHSLPVNFQLSLLDNPQQPVSHILAGLKVFKDDPVPFLHGCRQRTVLEGKDAV